LVLLHFPLENSVDFCEYELSKGLNKEATTMRKRRTFKTATLSPLVIEAAETDRAAAMAIFLLDNTDSIYGCWAGNMKAADQRILFGRFVGKGLIIISGDTETVGHSVSICFGTMRDTVWSARWVDLLH
jgi:hypothetical protein